MALVRNMAPSLIFKLRATEEELAAVWHVTVFRRFSGLKILDKIRSKSGALARAGSLGWRPGNQQDRVQERFAGEGVRCSGGSD